MEIVTQARDASGGFVGPFRVIISTKEKKIGCAREARATKQIATLGVGVGGRQGVRSGILGGRIDSGK